jgi:hypothetical protein
MPRSPSDVRRLPDGKGSYGAGRAFQHEATIWTVVAALSGTWTCPDAFAS